MEEHLDQILLEQLQSARRRKATYKRIKKFLKDPLLNYGEQQVDKFILYCECHIQNKQLILEKPKKRKEKNPDILAKNPFYETWRVAYMATVFSYKTYINYVSEYWSFNKKQK